MTYQIIKDFSDSPFNLYTGYSINDVEIVLHDFGINSKIQINILKYKNDQNNSKYEKYIRELDSRIMITNKSSNKKESVLSKYIITADRGIIFIIQYTFVEIANGCYQIDIIKVLHVEE